MLRWFRLCAVVALAVLAVSTSNAQLPVREVSGRIAPTDVRVFVKDTLYRINGQLMIAGTLIIEPGTTIELLNNGRIIDSVGGRLIADGRARATYSGQAYQSVNSAQTQAGRAAYDFSDPAYFFATGLISVSTPAEPTVADAKRDLMFHVVLDTLARRIENVPVGTPGNPGDTYVNWPVAANASPAAPVGGKYYPTFAAPYSATTGDSVGIPLSPSRNNTKFVVPYEYALMWITARLSRPNLDPAIRTLNWRRNNFSSPNVTSNRIRFVGRAFNSASREWGHMVVLPGARAAFFRDCDFQNFRKDTTVDRVAVYQTPVGGSNNPGNVEVPGTLNYRLASMTNGSGGVLSILSSRSWMVNCNFSNNMARYHGGAVQFLQAPQQPAGANQYPSLTSGAGATAYNALPASYNPADLGGVTVNPYLYNQNANDTTTLLPVPRSGGSVVPAGFIRAHDNIYSNTIAELSETNRQAIDDGRLAVYLGRVRQLTFTNNRTNNANIRIASTPLGPVVTDDVTQVAITTNGQSFKNEAHGGAIYMMGRDTIETGLGINNFNDNTGLDFIRFTNNRAESFVADNAGNGGAYGGALFAGGNTSVVVRGNFTNNRTLTNFVTSYDGLGLYNRGGGIYMAGSAGRLMLRGTEAQSAIAMYMGNNSAARGGAIYIGDNRIADPRPTPQVGGFSGNGANNLNNRGTGYNITFESNTASLDGGAIFSKRNMLLVGAGGVVNNVNVGYSAIQLLNFSNNSAGYSGGAVAIHLPGQIAQPELLYNRVVRSIFRNNTVGVISTADSARVRGGGALYVMNAELQAVLGSEFNNNRARLGNGGAIALINPRASFGPGSGFSGNFQRVFASDVDTVTYATNPAFISSFSSRNDIFTSTPGALQPNARMLTRFLDNTAIENASRMGDGVTQAGNVTTRHPGTGGSAIGADAGTGGALDENGTGLGGAIYVLDSVKADRAGRLDSVYFNRVRFQGQSAYSGAAIYSDNYDLKLIFLRSWVTNNVATSAEGALQNAIYGPASGSGATRINKASSDLASAIFYGEVIGPVPVESYSVASNSMYDNNARFLIRLPDAPNTKGLNAGLGLGYGGVDSLRGNYWGRTEANVTTNVFRFDINGNQVDTVQQETFFVAGDGTQQLRFIRGGSGKDQGPFDQNPLRSFSYTPIPMLNNGTDETTPDATSIAEKFLQQGRIYDAFDKGTDIKTADYASRRMSPIEDFAVGIPYRLRPFTVANQPSNGRYVKRWTRDPFVAAVDNNVASVQTEFKGDHPIGFPLYLESRADYTTNSDANINNNELRSIEETVFYVMNVTTGDYIRLNMAQLDNTSEVYRGRADIVPDSSNRIGDPTIRRNAEGLANFGTSVAAIVSAIKRNAANEDEAALAGRKYEGSVALNELGGSGFSLSNRPTLPASNNGKETYFAGERYRALPANVGDSIVIMSRSVLWYGANGEAESAALGFRVGASTPAPVWTGNVPQTRLPLQANGTPVSPEFLNRLFVSEDRVYPRDPSDASRPPGRDTIMAITARDTNLFFDPRSIYLPGQFSQLEYGWTVDPSTGLSRWLQADTIRANGTPNPWYQAVGYIRLKGQPSNPYVVPGGEKITVTARNFPPNFANVDNMKAAGIADSIIAKWVYLYPPYFANGAYDNVNARYLQQDTINFGGNADTAYTYTIHVTDSLPVYTATATACGTPTQFIANVTDSLRFKVDFDTDDESEDLAAETTGWTFPYGRTSYGFASISRIDNPGDTAVDRVQQVRPNWIAGAYMKQYDNSSLDDRFGSEFLTKGRINIRIPAATAIALLTPPNTVNGGLTVDTVITVVVNDGHSGVTSITRPIRINYAPEITTTSLPQAWEDIDYNANLTNDSTRVDVKDANFGDTHTFELIYANDPRIVSGVAKDGCFPEAGNWDLSNAATPRWLKINPTSGLLFGTPRIGDAPTDADTTVEVVVLVTDNGRLTAVRRLQLPVRGVNHNPEITAAPQVRCLEIGKASSDTVTVIDLDLRRNELLTVTVLSPSGFTASPATLDGYRSDSSARIAINNSNFQISPYATSIDFVIEVKDRAGKSDTLRYRMNVSEQTVWSSVLRVANNRGAFETLTWGTGANATTGDNNRLGFIGKLDSNYCEYEIPPVPVIDVFDARWSISNTQGTLRNIFPSCASGNTAVEAYKGFVQPGTSLGSGSAVFPITLSWNRTTVPARSNTQLNPCGGSFYLRDATSNGGLFNINMNLGVGFVSNPSIYEVVTAGDSITLVIKQDGLQNFIIVWDQATPVDNEPIAGESNGFELLGSQPNPFNGVTTIRYNVPVSANVRIDVYDNLGNKVANLANGVQSVGVNQVEWNGRDINGSELPSGAYTVRMSSGAFQAVQRVVIVR